MLIEYYEYLVDLHLLTLLGKLYYFYIVKVYVYQLVFVVMILHNHLQGSVERKPPSWRSAELNELLRSLDSRADANLKSARKQRVEGSPIKVAPPNGYPQWMIAPDEQ